MNKKLLNKLSEKERRLVLVTYFAGLLEPNNPTARKILNRIDSANNTNQLIEIFKSKDVVEFISSLNIKM